MARQAYSLDVFVAEVNKKAPKRSKVSDGGLASSGHHKQNPTSDHEPNSADVWTARDTTNDPDDMPGSYLAARLDSKFGKHPAMMSGSYIIFNGRIKSYNRRSEGWRKYTGPNQHKTHVHLSVSDDRKGYDSREPWNLFGVPKQKAVAPTKVQKMHAKVIEARKNLFEATALGKSTPANRKVVHEIAEHLEESNRILYKLEHQLPDK